MAHVMKYFALTLTMVLIFGATHAQGRWELRGLSHLLQSADGEYKLVEVPMYKQARLYLRDSLLIQYSTEAPTWLPQYPDIYQYSEDLNRPTDKKALIERFGLDISPHRLDSTTGISYEITLIKTERRRVYGCSRDLVGHMCDVYTYQNRIYLGDRLVHMRQYISECQYDEARLLKSLKNEVRIWADPANKEIYLYGFGEVAKTVKID